jgi:hypothetical protein
LARFALPPDLARHGRVIDHRFVDRPLADVGPKVGRKLDDFRRNRQLLRNLIGAGNALAVLNHRLGRVRAIRDDQHRPGHDLRPAPARGDRARRLLLLGLSIVDQQPDRKERDSQQEADDDREE